MRSFFNLPTLLLTSLVIKCLYSGTGLGEALALLSLSALYAGQKWLELQQQIPVNKAILDRLVEVEEQVRVAKDSLNGLKIASTYSLRK